jgi:hypothetical protein
MMTTGMTTSPVLKPLVLTAEERETLERWARRPKTSQGLAQRARIILASAEGKNNTHVAIALRLNRTTVKRWRSRFMTKRLDGLLDEPRPGAPRTISDAEVERVIARTLEYEAARRDPLEHAIDGARAGDVPERHQPHLASVQPSAASNGNVQALQGPALHREGEGHRRAVPVSA